MTSSLHEAHCDPFEPDAFLALFSDAPRWLVCGTVPFPQMGLAGGEAHVQLAAGKALRSTTKNEALAESSLVVRCGSGALPLPLGRGTAALASAASIVLQELGAAPPLVLVAGDNGDGKGSRLLYNALCRYLKAMRPYGITFHYFLPDVDGHNRVLMALDELGESGTAPLLCADAGYMYAAKMSGYARRYDLFTPDAGELAFLADEYAPHPFYTRGFLLAEPEKSPERIARAHEHENDARAMLVKGAVDHVVMDGRIVRSVDYPSVPNLEPIGGTGDTVAGSATALLAAGYDMERACTLAALANRIMGQLAQPTPATQVDELLAQLPEALRMAMQEDAC